MKTEATQTLEREIAAFRTMHTELLDKFFGEYVAVRCGQVADHDPSLLAIYLRIDAKYPDETVLIKRVQLEIERIVTVRSPRIVSE